MKVNKNYVEYKTDIPLRWSKEKSKEKISLPLPFPIPIIRHRPKSPRRVQMTIFCRFSIFMITPLHTLIQNYMRICSYLLSQCKNMDTKIKIIFKDEKFSRDVSLTNTESLICWMQSRSSRNYVDNTQLTNNAKIAC